MALIPLLAISLVAACSSATTPDTPITAPTVSSTSSPAPTPSASASSSTTTSATPPTTPTPPPVPTEIATVARDLDVPWGLAFLPDGSALLTLRDQAELIQIREGAGPKRLGQVQGVDPDGEGGLLGVAVSPDYAQDSRIYLYFTARDDNRVVRMTFENGVARAPEPILTGIPKAGNHNGGRIAFGPDGFLYVATGDAGDGANSQDRQSLGGKILRITADGDPAPGNPFGDSPVWSYGHRNVQGLAWDSDRRMYASEFGQNTWDELNLIQPGRNYGWPEVEGRADRSGFVDPLRQWTTDESSPSGIAIADNVVYMAALRGESLWRIPLRDGAAGEPTRLLRGDYGRLRDAIVGPDGRLWVLTNNTSRGDPSADDDLLLAIPPALLR
jgi:glucose/arabinose dehydrogenase